MIAALLCPGPSLARLTDLPKVDVVCCVNRAAIRWPCDVWAAIDQHLTKRIWRQVIGKPILLTNRLEGGEVIRKGFWPVDRLAFTDDLRTERCAGWSLRSATSAVVYLAERGAERIDVYGCDLAGDADWDGIRPSGAIRDAGRWNDEGATWAALTQRFNLHRVTL
jgi:hypothetical protein